MAPIHGAKAKPAVRSLRFLIFFLALIACLLAAPAACSEIQFTSKARWPDQPRTGLIHQTAVSGSVAYILCQDGLQLVDVFNAGNPIGARLLSNVKLRNPKSSFAVANQHAFICSFNGLEVINVADPQHPIYRTNFSNLTGTSILASGNRAYILRSNQSLLVYDITDPLSPIQLGSLSTTLTQLVRVENGLVYGFNNSVFAAINVLNPSALYTQGSIPVSYPTSIAFRNGRAYVANTSKVMIVDISVLNWTSLGTLTPSPTLPNVIAISNDYIFIRDYPEGIGVFKLQNDTSISRVGAIPTHYCPASLQVLDGRLYVTEASSSDVDHSVTDFEMFDIATPTNAVRLAAYCDNSSATGLSISGSVLAISDGFGSFKVLDISAPSAPRSLTNFPVLPGTPWLSIGASIIGHWALGFINDDHYSMALHDLSSLGLPLPSAIDRIGKFMAIANGLGYAAQGRRGLQIYDLAAEPPINRPLGNFGYDPYFFWPTAIAVAGNFAFIADGDYGGIAVVDISNSASPQFVSRVKEIGTPAFDIALYANYAYLTHPAGGLSIFSIADPHNPTLVTKIQATDSFTAIEISGNHAFCSGYLGNPPVPKIIALDLTDPTHPVVDGQINLDAANDIVLSGHLAYVAEGTSGIRILDFSPRLNLAAKSTATQLELIWPDTTGAEEFRLQTSTDLKLWTDLFPQTNHSQNQYTATLSKPSQPSYFRLFRP